MVGKRGFFGLFDDKEEKISAKSGILKSISTKGSSQSLNWDAEAQVGRQSESRYILHVGTFKTGTTALQNIAFPNLKNFVYLGKTRALKEVWKAINIDNALQRDLDRISADELAHIHGAVLNQFSKCLGTRNPDKRRRIVPLADTLDRLGQIWAKNHGQNQFIWSSEGLLTGRGHRGPEGNHPPTDTPPLSAFRLLSGQNTILLVLREPTSLLFSRYMQLQFQRSKLDLAIHPTTQFLDHQERAYGKSVWDSVFQHALQKTFVDQLRSLGCGELVLLSYERDLLGRPVADILGEAAGLEFHDPEAVSTRMKNESWNAQSDGAKARSLKAVLEQNGQTTLQGLKTS